MRGSDSDDDFNMSRNDTPTSPCANLDDVSAAIGRIEDVGTLENEVPPTELLARTIDAEAILSSGTSRHFVTNLDLLSNYAAFGTPRHIFGVFGARGLALGEGDVEIVCGTRSVRLRHALYAPGLGVNIISLTQMMISGYKFTNTRSLLSLYTSADFHLADFPIRPLIKFKLRSKPGRLRSIPDRSSLSHPIESSLAVSAEEVQRWHNRLGHISDARLRHAIGPMGGEKISDRCETCVKAKATRKGEKKGNDKYFGSRAGRKLERIAADTWGPSPVRGVRGERYAVLLIDSWSRYAWIETVSNTGAIGNLVKARLRREQRSEQIDIISFDSDNGIEFVNPTVQSYLRDSGIQPHITDPCVYGQNGLIANRWRTLLETTRALLVKSKMPESTWPQALKTAVYLYNRSPSVGIGNATPFERYYGKKADLAHLRVWGCEAWLALPEERMSRGNLGSREVKARLVGYTEDQKGWRFWVPKWKKEVVWWEIARWVEDMPDGIDYNYDRWMEEPDDERI